jgi:hypothetical protein
LKKKVCKLSKYAFVDTISFLCQNDFFFRRNCSNFPANQQKPFKFAILQEKFTLLQAIQYYRSKTGKFTALMEKDLEKCQDEKYCQVMLKRIGVEEGGTDANDKVLACDKDALDSYLEKHPLDYKVLEKRAECFKEIKDLSKMLDMKKSCLNFYNLALGLYDKGRCQTGQTDMDSQVYQNIRMTLHYCRAIIMTSGITNTT